MRLLQYTWLHLYINATCVAPRSLTLSTSDSGYASCILKNTGAHFSLSTFSGGFQLVIQLLGSFSFLQNVGRANGSKTWLICCFLASCDVFTSQIV